MSEPTEGRREWCGRDGNIIYKGVNYSLRDEAIENLKMLDLSIRNDHEAVKQMLKKVDLGEHRGEAEILASIHKQQLTAIIMEFLRRKKMIRPLEDFVLSAVHDLYGKETLEKVKERARQYQEKDHKKKNPLDEKTGIGIPRFAYSKDRMCGTPDRMKVKHPTREAANAQITEMRERGMNTKGMSSYGPCPYCGSYHVGHKPKKIWDRARMEHDEQSAAEGDVLGTGLQSRPSEPVAAEQQCPEQDTGGSGDAGYEGTGGFHAFTLSRLDGDRGNDQGVNGSLPIDKSGEGGECDGHEADSQ